MVKGELVSVVPASVIPGSVIPCLPKNARPFDSAQGRLWGTRIVIQKTFIRPQWSEGTCRSGVELINVFPVAGCVKLVTII